MTEELWVVRAGRGARFADDFLDGSYIAIAFREFASDDLSATNDEELRHRASTYAQRTYARQLIAFAYRLEVGDLVLVPRLTPTHRDYLAARITGPYRHVAEA